ncbi:hypothetical protein QYF61_017422 [Mycteria americana]|uniref:Uncharacterized protein n=1 Tax=Mycteria americana TaxID=33587 RepID=A0AAN7NM14_MYCAM|nr:hypothetical protein QYF61_017422 [Mycteria americana]
MSSLALVTIRSSIASPWVGLSITWVKKLSSMHSRSVLDCLQLAMQMSGWLKSPSRTRACECEASCSWRKKASPGQLFTLYPFLDIEGNTSVPPSVPVPSEQPVAITPVMGFVPPGFSNGNQLTRACKTTTLSLSHNKHKEPMPASSKTDPPLAKAKPINDGGSTSVIT